MKELSRPAGFMDMDMFRSLIDRLSPQLAWLTLYFQGEPYLNPLFFDFTAYAKSKGIFISSSTNGHFLDAVNAEATVKSGLDRLIISVDGTDQQVYESYRAGGSLQKVIQGIKALAKAKRRLRSNTPKIIIQFLVLRSNQNQLHSIRKKGIEWGGDKVEIKTAQFYNFKNGNPLMPSSGKYSRYRMEDGGWRIKNKFPNHCFRMWSSCVITWDGRVVPCCYDKDARNVLGDIGVNSFSEIWKSSEYRGFRQMILSQRKQLEICTNCTEGMGMSRWL
jgi:radical SAM protein with 4Fe4S-binding SPASM domain